jgi:hypothetical protein
MELEDVSILQELTCPSTSKTSATVSIDEIYPVPQALPKTNKRKSQSKKSSILTSSPFLDNLKNKASTSQDKLEKAKNTAIKKIAKKLKFSSVKSIKSKSLTEGKKGVVQNAGVCPGCQEFYSEPPEVDLIQCSTGQDWWHELCTSYTGGIFVCNLCGQK